MLQKSLLVFSDDKGKKKENILLEMRSEVYGTGRQQRKKWFIRIILRNPERILGEYLFSPPVVSDLLLKIAKLNSEIFQETYSETSRLFPDCSRGGVPKTAKQGLSALIRKSGRNKEFQQEFSVRQSEEDEYLIDAKIAGPKGQRYVRIEIQKKNAGSEKKDIAIGVCHSQIEAALDFFSSPVRETSLNNISEKYDGIFGTPPERKEGKPQGIRERVLQALQ